MVREETRNKLKGIIQVPDDNDGDDYACADFETENIEAGSHFSSGHMPPMKCVLFSNSWLGTSGYRSQLTTVAHENLKIVMHSQSLCVGCKELHNVTAFTNEPVTTVHTQIQLHS